MEVKCKGDMKSHNSVRKGWPVGRVPSHSNQPYTLGNKTWIRALRIVLRLIGTKSSSASGASLLDSRYAGTSVLAML